MDATTISRGFPWLTVAEAQAATQAVMEAIRQARTRTRDDHPPGARRVVYFWALAPLAGDAPEPEASDHQITRAAGLTDGARADEPV